MSLETNQYSERIFSYGTLRYESVQLTTFGRRLEGQSDELTAYSLSMVAIKDPKVVATSGEAVHPILSYTGNHTDKVTGVVFAISPEELKQADEYEVDEYKRVQLQLASGIKAWVYVNANEIE